MSTVSIPEQCVNCPVTTGLVKRIESFEEKIDRTISSSVSDVPEQLAEFFLHATTEAGVDAGNLFDPDQLPTMIREVGGKAIEALESQAQRTREALERHTAGCQGPLGMRAIRDHVEYTARVCTSPRLMEMPASAEPAKVTRKQIS